MALGGSFNLTGSKSPLHGQRLPLTITATGFDFTAQDEVRCVWRTTPEGTAALTITGSTDTNSITLADGSMTILIDSLIVATPDLSEFWTTFAANIEAHLVIEYRAASGESYQPFLSGPVFFAYPGVEGAGAAASQTVTVNTGGVALTTTITTVAVSAGDVVALINAAAANASPASGFLFTGVNSDGTTLNQVDVDNLPAGTPADNSITLAKMAHGTDGNLITYDAAGAPAYVATGTAAQVLTSNGPGAAPTMQDAGAGSGDMTAAVYDPNTVAGDAFDMAQMVEAADAKVLTAAERTLLGNTSGANTGDEAAASATVSGTVELATIAEVDTGTDTVRAITPAGLAGSALQSTADSALQSGDINTLAELNAIVADATLIDTGDSRLSDARTPTAHSHEGTAVLSTGEVGGSKFLREDGDGTCSWQAIGGGGDMLAANNLSDVANVGTSRTNLGVAIGTDVQAQDDLLQDLADIAGTFTADGEMIVATGVGAAAIESGATLRSSIGVDVAGTDNSTDVTLAGSPDYITIAGQVITRNAIDLTTDVTGDLPVADGGTGSSTAGAARTALGTDDATNLTTGTLPAARLGADSIDTITEIAAALKSGADGTLITGTAGSTDEGAKFNVDGDLVTTGVAAPTTLPRQVGKETIYIPAAAMKETVSNGCAAIATAETTAGQPDLQVLDFDATADEHAQFAIAFPKAWNLGTVTFQVFWTVTAAVSTGVAWGLQGVAVADNGAIAVAYGTAVVVTDDAQGASNEMLVSAESGAVTIAGTPADDEMCFFRVFRDVSDANDDMTQDARLMGVKLFFTTDAANDD